MLAAVYINRLSVGKTANAWVILSLLLSSSSLLAVKDSKRFAFSQLNGRKNEIPTTHIHSIEMMHATS